MENMEMMELWKICEAGMIKASDALAKMTGNEVKIRSLSTELIKIEQITKFFNPDETIISVFMPIYGDNQGCALVIFEMDSSQQLINILMEKIGTTTVTYELYESSLKEIGNIMTGAFLTVIANMSDLKLVEGIPIYKKSMIGTLIEDIIIGFAQKQKDDIVSIQVGYIINNVEIQLHLFMVFENTFIGI